MFAPLVPLAGISTRSDGDAVAAHHGACLLKVPDAGSSPTILHRGSQAESTPNPGFRCHHPFMTTSFPKIRPASIADVSDMFKVRASVVENTMTPDELSAAGVTPEAIALAVRSEPCAWVATLGEEVVGFAMVDFDSGCLFALFVLPEHEGCGIGSRLTRTCELALFERHATAWLETASGSRAAQLYRHLGWGNETEIGG